MIDTGELVRRAFFRSAVVGGVLLTWWLAEDWIAAAALGVLWAAWRYLDTDEGPPVLALAFSFQWVQVVIGLLYYAASGRRLREMDAIDYRPMVLIGLGCLLALLIGMIAGLRWARPPRSAARRWPEEAFSLWTLVGLYGVSIALGGVLQELAWTVPGLTQSILGLTMSRFVLLFLMFRRLAYPRLQWGPMALLLLGEVALGFTGYFAGFREAFIIAVLAILERFDSRRLRYWATVMVLAAAAFLSGVVWTGIKSDYRRDFDTDLYAESRLTRLDRVASLSSDWFTRDWEDFVADLDRMVGRLWAVYYPALALDRVPSVVPHTDGEILWQATVHVLTPRALYPDKAETTSDSEMVRKYAGVWVAGPERGTSIAFGYAGESYVDFGLPWMFLPIFAFGLLVGVAYQWLLRLIRHRELAVALVTVVFWLSVYLFERSWLKMLGSAVTLATSLGVAALALDQLAFAIRRRATRGRISPYPMGGRAAVPGELPERR
jgi:hypothetical protein